MELGLRKIKTPSGDTYRVAAFLYRGQGEFNRSPKHLVILANAVNEGMLIDASPEAFDNCEMTGSSEELQISDFFNYPGPDIALGNPPPSLVLELKSPIAPDNLTLKIGTIYELGNIKHKTVADILQGLKDSPELHAEFSDNIRDCYKLK